jgi:sensor domain CHASE-containing protein
MPWVLPGRNFGVRSLQNPPSGDVMKRIAAFILVVLLSVAGAIPAQGQLISVAENERQSRKEIKKQQKMLNKANKKQQKTMKKYEKAQRKAAKKANRRYRK